MRWAIIEQVLRKLQNLLLLQFRGAPSRLLSILGTESARRRCGVYVIDIGIARPRLGTSESVRRRCGVYIGDSPDKVKDKVKQNLVHVLCRLLHLR